MTLYFFFRIPGDAGDKLFVQGDIIIGNPMNLSKGEFHLKGDLYEQYENGLLPDETTIHFSGDQKQTVHFQNPGRGHLGDVIISNQDTVKFTSHR